MAINQTNNYNLGPIDNSVNKTVDPRRYFNNYFDQEFNVTPNVNSAILSYFEEQTGNKAAAKALASAVIYTSQSQGMDPMATLTDFTKMPKGELNAYLTMFLNLQRVGTSYLGITNQPVTNRYVNRAILP